MRVNVFPDAGALAAAGAEYIGRICGTAVAEHGAFHLVLAGGNTPGRCYELLTAMDLPWRKLHIYFGDERCLPAGDIGRNDRMARAAWLDHVSIPADQIHPIPAELGPDEGAALYSRILTGIPSLDLVLLGVGEDGHTASLFPSNPALADERLAVPVFSAPKPPPERVSMGLTALNGAERRMVMAAGISKRDALRRISDGEEALPAARLRDCLWYVDAEAGGYGLL